MDEKLPIITKETRESITTETSYFADGRYLFSETPRQIIGEPKHDDMPITLEQISENMIEDIRDRAEQDYEEVAHRIPYRIRLFGGAVLILSLLGGTEEWIKGGPVATAPFLGLGIASTVCFEYSRRRYIEHSRDWVNNRRSRADLLNRLLGAKRSSNRKGYEPSAGMGVSD
jgi:hypothetical protein